MDDRIRNARRLAPKSSLGPLSVSPSLCCTFNFPFHPFFLTSNISTLWRLSCVTKKNFLLYLLLPSHYCLIPLLSYSDKVLTREDHTHIWKEKYPFALSTCLSSISCLHIRPPPPRLHWNCSCQRLLVAFILSSPYSCLFWFQSSIQRYAPLPSLKHSLPGLLVLLLLGC